MTRCTGTPKNVIGQTKLMSFKKKTTTKNNPILFTIYDPEQIYICTFWVKNLFKIGTKRKSIGVFEQFVVDLSLHVSVLTQLSHLQ